MLRNLSAALVLGLFLSQTTFAAPSIAYAKVKAAGTVAHVVTVNLADKNVRLSVALPQGGVGATESFKSIVRRVRPYAAMTGTFYDTRTYIPTGDIALCGKLVHSGCVGSAICIDKDNKASVARRSSTCAERWEGFETVLCAGPTLVRNGVVAIALRHEGFRRSLLASARRTGIGVTAKGKLLLVAVNRRCSLYRFAKLMIKCGAVEALCLDGGSSTGFYQAGKFLAVPSRAMTNVIVVYETVGEYDKALHALAPARLLARMETPWIPETEPRLPHPPIVLPPTAAQPLPLGASQ